MAINPQNPTNSLKNPDDSVTGDNWKLKYHWEPAKENLNQVGQPIKSAVFNYSMNMIKNALDTLLESETHISTDGGNLIITGSDGGVLVTPTSINTLIEAGTSTLNQNVANNTSNISTLSSEVVAQKLSSPDGSLTINSNSAGTSAVVNWADMPIMNITSVSVVASQADMLALTGLLVGAIAVNTTDHDSFILTAQPASNLANWAELGNISTAPVQSVNGMTGSVTVATISGNAGTASALQVPQPVTVTGDVTAPQVNWDGAEPLTLATTLANVTQNNSTTNLSVNPSGTFEADVVTTNSKGQVLGINKQTITMTPNKQSAIINNGPYSSNNPTGTQVKLTSRDGKYTFIMQRASGGWVPYLQNNTSTAVTAICQWYSWYSGNSTYSNVNNSISAAANSLSNVIDTGSGIGSGYATYATYQVMMSDNSWYTLQVFTDGSTATTGRMQIALDQQH